MHRVDELLQADAAVVVLVEDMEHALHEERLRGKDALRHIVLYPQLLAEFITHVF